MQQVRIPDAEFGKRIAALRAKMAEAGVDLAMAF